MLIAWFNAIHKNEIAAAGGKGANLGEMVRAGLPVPPGFVITTSAYRTFVEANGLQPRILELARAALPDDPTAIEHASHSIRHLFDQATIPAPIATTILEAYDALSESEIRNPKLRLLSAPPPPPRTSPPPLSPASKKPTSTSEVKKPCWQPSRGAGPVCGPPGP